MKNFNLDGQALSPKGQHLPLWPFLLLGGIAIASVASGFLGFKLGDEALKGVSQPEINPAQKSLDRPTKPQEVTAQGMVVFKPVDEGKVLKQVKSYIVSKGGKNAVDNGSKPNSKKSLVKSAPKSTESKPETKKN
jgi:hypothetical protein